MNVQCRYVSLLRHWGCLSPELEKEIQARAGRCWPDRLWGQVSDALLNIPRAEKSDYQLEHRGVTHVGLTPGACGASFSGYHARRLHDDLHRLHWRLGVTEATYLASEVERKLWPLPVDTCKHYGISLRVTDDPSCLTRPGVVFVTPDHLL